MDGTQLTRRRLLQSGAATAAALTFGPPWLRQALAAPATGGASPYGPLGAADANSLMLPPGFTSRLVARGLAPVSGSGYVWPIFSDGQATFRTGDGGWILVTNSESLAALGAGSSAIRFSPDGAITDAYRILGGTNANCAGGPSRWGTWLSCEEADDGLVWECDPAGVLPAEARPALGVFKHEAATVDPVAGRVYLTEDSPDAGLYRFTPDDYPSLERGTLEVATGDPDGVVGWEAVPDPTTARTGVPTRQQVPGMARFQSAEGIWYAGGVCYFTTKTDKVVWAYDCRSNRIERLFDRRLAMSSSLDAVDNVTCTAVGDVLVCEDGGNLEVALITAEREISPLLRFTGPDHEGSEVCGAVFDPSGTRLYVTSQRAFPVGSGQPGPGAVYEISGPFRLPAGGVGPEFVFGPPAGELRGDGPLNPGGDGAAPAATAGARGRVSRRSYLRRGVRLRVRADEVSSVAAQLDTPSLRSERGAGGTTDRPVNVVLGRAQGSVEASGGVAELRLPPPGRESRRLLAGRRGAVHARLLVSVVDASGNETVLTKRVRIGRRD